MDARSCVGASERAPAGRRSDSAPPAAADLPRAAAGGDLRPHLLPGPRRGAGCGAGADAARADRLRSPAARRRAAHRVGTMSLAGARVWITGASSGIGEAIITPLIAR